MFFISTHFVITDIDCTTNSAIYKCW